MNYEIIEGLRNALARGNTLQQAMMSFYNAGYKKEDIEEAARALHGVPSQPLSNLQKPIPKQIEKPLPLSPAPPSIQEKEETLESLTAKDMQLVSKYEGKQSGGKLTNVLLIVTLIVFILVIIGVVMFFNELMDFFKSLF